MLNVEVTCAFKVYWDDSFVKPYVPGESGEESVGQEAFLCSFPMVTGLLTFLFLGICYFLKIINFTHIHGYLQRNNQIIVLLFFR